MPTEIDAGRLVDEELERALVNAVRASLRRPGPIEVVAKALCHLSRKKLGATGECHCRRDPPEKCYAMLWEAWANAVVKDLTNAGLINLPSDR